MKKRFFAAFVISSLIGTGMHFLYDLLPSPITAVFAPVNESIWEHLKLSFWPFLGAAFVLNRKQKHQRSAWGAALSALVLMPLFLTGLYYTLLSGFAVESDAINVALYYLTMAFGFWVFYKLRTSGAAAKWVGFFVILAGVFGAALIFFTPAPPNLPIFIDFSAVS